MQPTVETLEGLKRRLKVIVPADKVQKAYNAHLTKIAKTARIDGFRPGKVPVDLIEKRYASGIKYEVAGELIESSIKDAMTQHDIRLAGQPEVDGDPSKLSKNEPFEYTLLFEVLPEIELVDLTGVTIEKSTASVTDADVDGMIEKLRRQYAQWEDVSRASAEGDRLVLDFKGYIGDEPFEGGEAKDFQLELGSKQMIPGFEDALIGVQPEETKEITITFPKEYPAEDLASKEARFEIKVHKVQEAKLPPVDDALVEKMGIKEGGIEKLREEVREGMEMELDNAIDLEIKEAVLKSLVDKNPADLPEQLVESEIEHLQNMTRQQMATREGSKELPKIDLPREPYVEQAKRRVILGLLLAEVIKKYDLKPDPSKVRKHIEKMTAAYQGAEEIINMYYKNENLMSEVEAAVLEEAAVEKLLETAETKEKPGNYDSIVNPK